MEDESSAPLDGKVLGNLRVVDLKHELEKRGLSKSGSKKDLIKRLKQQLEFEKLCEERKSGDYDLKLQLDADIEKNEFVQQYLAQQQKRKEEKRLELEALQNLKKQKHKDNRDEQGVSDEITNSESDETSYDKVSRSQTNISTQSSVLSRAEQDKIKDEANVLVTEADENNSSDSETEEQKNIGSPASISANEVCGPKTPESPVDDLENLSEKQKCPPFSSNDSDRSHKRIKESPPNVSVNEIHGPKTPASPDTLEILHDEQKSPSFTANYSDRTDKDKTTRESPDKYSVIKVHDPQTPTSPIGTSENLSYEQKSLPFASNDLYRTEKYKKSKKLKESANVSENKVHAPQSPTSPVDTSEHLSNKQNHPLFRVKDLNRTEKNKKSKKLKESSIVSTNEVSVPQYPTSPVDTSENLSNEQNHPLFSAKDSEREEKDKKSEKLKEGSSVSANKVHGLQSPTSPVDTAENSRNEQNHPIFRANNSKRTEKDEKCTLLSVSTVKHTEDDQNKFCGDSLRVKENEYESHVSISHIPENRGEIKHLSSTECIKGNKIETYAISQFSEKDVETTATVKGIYKDTGKNNKTLGVKSSNITENIECLETQTSASNAFEKNKLFMSSDASVEKSSSERSCRKDSVSKMEPTQCSSVPYSLSDIQLPESPGTLSSKLKKNEESSKKASVDSEKTDQSSHLDNKIQSNGVTVAESLQHDSEVPSEPESKGIDMNDSPQIIPKQKKESNDSRQSEKSESSDAESEKDDCHGEKKLSKCEDISNIPVDSEPSRDSSYEKKSIKAQSEESDIEKSSDSGHKSRQKNLLHDKHSKRSRRSRSSTSSSSSDSSPKRRHSKKSPVSTKSKISVKNNENDHIPGKSFAEKSKTHASSARNVESTSVPTVSLKKRLKIKRDNVPVEIKSNVECGESSSKIEKKNNSPSSQSVSDKPSKLESTEKKDAISELYVPRKISLSNRKLNRTSSEDNSADPKSKKNKWGSFATSKKTSQNISISTDSLKNWFPDFKLITEPATREVEPEEPSLPTIEEKNSNLVLPETYDENDSGMKETSSSQMEVEEGESQEKDEDLAEQGPITKMIFIQNLVRPFTLNQLKDLLKQSGKIVEEYFWIDKIKSKCFVMYEAEKEAVKARKALNNTRWPPSNPKILSVEFSNEEELENQKKGNEPPPKPVTEIPVVVPQETTETRVHSADEHKRRERERRKDRDRSKPQPPIREWDKDKVMQASPEREHASKEEKPRSSEKKDKKESKKRPNEDTSAKLLDDLFQKTKTPPCIYWLPLTEEQAKVKEDAKKLRKLEREKRNQQKEQEEAERRNRFARSSRRSREKENRKSSTRSRSPVSRRR